MSRNVTVNFVKPIYTALTLKATYSRGSSTIDETGRELKHSIKCAIIVNAESTQSS